MASVPTFAASPLTILTPITSIGDLTETGDPINLFASLTSQQGSITLNGDVFLGTDVSLVAPGGTVTINGKVDGAHKLTFVAADVKLNGAVGTQVPLSSLSTTGPATVAGGAVVTSGGQQYIGAMQLLSSTVLTSGGPLNIVGGVSAAPTTTLTLNATNNVVLGKVRGANMPMTLAGGASTKVLLDGSNSAAADHVTITSTDVGSASGDTFFSSGGKFSYSGGVGLIEVDGGPGVDTFLVTPSSTTLFTLLGNGASDSLTVDLSGVTTCRHLSAFSPMTAIRCNCRSGLAW